MYLVLGNIITHNKNCACGETKVGFCKECKTEALDIVCFNNVENIYQGQENEDKSFHIENTLVSKEA